MFWEPGYDTMTRFVTRLSPPGRAAIHFVAGTFEADGDRVRRDAERALRSLGVERLAVFLLFWVRSWARVSGDVLAALQRLRDAGKVASFGLSTHQRGLAVEALERGWDPVMVRHSAAHRKAEAEIFPRAVGTRRGADHLQRHLLRPPPRPARRRAARPTRPTATATASRSRASRPASPHRPRSMSSTRTSGRSTTPSSPRRRMAALRARGDLVYREDVRLPSVRAAGLIPGNSGRDEKSGPRPTKPLTSRGHASPVPYLYECRETTVVDGPDDHPRRSAAALATSGRAGAALEEYHIERPFEKGGPPSALEPLTSRGRGGRLAVPVRLASAPSPAGRNGPPAAYRRSNRYLRPGGAPPHDSLPDSWSP